MVSASLIIEGTDVPDDGAPAYATLLSQNVPNPFNPNTRIDYSLARRGSVRLRVYDAAGRMLRTLVDQVQGEGPHTVTWDGRGDAGKPMASGIYFYRLETADEIQTKRMVLIK
jgi:hypothetical protein